MTKSDLAPLAHAVPETVHREFGPFVAECNKRGIGRTKAYELDASGLLETFTIGSKRFVYIDSLLTLPQRLQGQEEAA